MQLAQKLQHSGWGMLRACKAQMRPDHCHIIAYDNADSVSCTYRQLLHLDWNRKQFCNIATPSVSCNCSGRILSVKLLYVLSCNFCTQYLALHTPLHHLTLAPGIVMQSEQVQCWLQSHQTAGTSA
jgi:hypothetical protein